MGYIESLMATGETVQFVTRQHWLTPLRSLLTNGTALALTLLASGFASQRAAAGAGTGWQLGVAVCALIAAVFVVRLAKDFLTWWNLIYIVSTRRVLEIEGVFNKVVRDSNLDKVNDIILRQSFLGRILGYGELEIITGSDVGVNQFHNLSHPIEFKRKILDNKEDFDTLSRSRHSASAARADAAHEPATTAAPDEP